MSVSDIIVRLRKERGLTQDQLAAKLFVTRQAVSRWETGESEPSIDMRKKLAEALDVSDAQLLDSPALERWSSIENTNKSANAAKSLFYVCSTCGNIVWSMGELACSCCGKPLEALVAQPADESHAASVETIDGCHVVSLEHPMAKDHHIRFIACVVDNLVRIKRLYPEQEAIAHFFMQGPSSFYAYCSMHGLIKY